MGSDVWLKEEEMAGGRDGKGMEGDSNMNSS